LNMKRTLSFGFTVLLSAFLSIGFYSCSSGGGGAPPPAGVTITESGSPASTDVVEDGATDTYDVVLDTQPSTDVTITVTPDVQTSVDRTTLTFTSSNFDQPQTVTVTAVDDAVIEGSHTSTITHTAASTDTGYDSITISSVTANITDNDGSVTITESGGSTDVAEGGATDTYNVVLDSQPAADVTIAITTDGETTVNPPSLIFTDADFNVAQTVTVTAFNDAIGEGNHTSTASHSATSTDPAYNGTAINDVIANITDNEACFAYAANFSLDEITSYSLDPTTGALTVLALGTASGATRPYALTAVTVAGNSFLYVAHSGSNNISKFAIGPTGTLTPIGSPILTGGTTPRLLDADPSGKFLYVANRATNDISGFSIEPTMTPQLFLSIQRPVSFHRSVLQFPQEGSILLL
jgi:hypothetical protein